MNLVLAFTAYLCPGAVTFLGFSIALARLPESAKPALAVVGVCEARPTVELYDPARSVQARRRVLELGRPAQLYPCSAAGCGGPLVDWKTVATFKEAP